MIPRVTLTPGGGRSPSTETPPAAPSSNGSPRPSRDRRMRPSRWRAIAVALVRWGVLFGGLVIIADLASLAVMQRTLSADDQQAIYQTDLVLNWVLFSVLGVVVARATRLVYSGFLAGILAALVDTTVVTAAQLMAPIGISPLTALDALLRGVLINIGWAGISGLMYMLMQRSAGGPRSR